MFVSCEVDNLTKPYLSNPFGKKKDKRIESWLEIMNTLPCPANKKVSLESEVRVDFEDDTFYELKDLLLRLSPWRKGPFHIREIFIDSEWRSDEKWKRFKKLNIDLKKKNILDVGSGNGYYAFRMLGDGANNILCLEPNLVHVSQFAALNRFVTSDNIRMLPERLENIKFSDTKFDVVFSMGLLYHQRDPSQHIKDLKNTLKDGGQLVIETIVSPEAYGNFLEPSEGRYASMPNVHYVHTDKGCKKLFEELSLSLQCESYNTRTTGQEQRKTEWMPFKSFESALNPSNLDLTIEGYPAPERKFYVLEKEA